MAGGNQKFECPNCETTRIETESLKEKLKENAGLGAGLGLGALALPIATLPAAIGGAVAMKLYDYIQGETVKCAECGHKWVVD